MPTTHRPRTVAAILLAMFMSAMEATVIATAMPTVIGDLGGLTLYGWVGAAYLLAATVTVPLYGKLADIYGRKPVLLGGIALFLIGSMASGMSTSILQLIVFRAVQGAGAGAVQPVTLTIVGDIYTLEERGRAQGMFGAVWGIAGVAGPLLGGWIVKLLGWRWVFFINVPFGIVSALLLVTSFHETAKVLRRKLDWVGALTLTVSSLGLLLGSSGKWPAITLPIGVASLVAFVMIERAVDEPIVPMDLLSRRAMAVACFAAALFGASMMATLTYVPLFIQEVGQKSPTEAGGIVTPMLVGWPLAATLTSRAIVRVGFRLPIRAGAVFVAGSSAVFAWAIEQSASNWVLQLIMFVFGIGMGLSNTAIVIAVQSSVGWEQRGVATATSLFARSMGGALGVGALGAILSAKLGDLTNHGEGGVAAAIDADLMHRISLGSALQTIFWVTAAMGFVNVLAVVFYPRGEAPSDVLDIGPMAEVTLRFRHNPATGKRELVISYESDDDALAHEHERDHRALVEKLIGQPIGDDTEIVIERGGKEGVVETPPGETARAPEAQKQGTLSA